jgi:AhpD family alkylhydroperoxidase
MEMDNTKDIIQEFQSVLARWEREWPKHRAGFRALGAAVMEPGALDTKTKELCAIATAVTAHCHWCIAAHVRNALNQGATREEVMEAGWVAVQMGGGPSLAYLQLVQKALDDLAPQK